MCTADSGTVVGIDQHSSNYLSGAPRPARVVIVDSLDDFHEIIGGVGGERVPARVEAEGGAARHLQLEADVAGRGVEELGVPVSVGGHRRREGDAAAARPQRDLAEGGAVGREVARRAEAG